jgi:acetyl-CoA carboxylase biotin carboxyl carrier protein
MVGTFYISPSPEDPPFIKVGERVDKNSVVCIIEAMKVMNEIKANVTGTVAEVLVETGQPVEFGTKLFRITE